MRLSRTLQFAIALTIGITFGFVLGTSATGAAHPPANQIPKEWESDPYYYFGRIDAPLNGLTAKTSIHYGDNPWDANSGTWLDFHNSGYQDPNVSYTGNPCTTGSGTAVWIVTQSLSNLALTAQCSTTFIDRAVIRLDDTRNDWYTGASWSVPSTRYDLRSVVVHEFGHAGGFFSVDTAKGHWNGVGEDCTGSDRETMCAGVPKGTSYLRSISTHENHTFDAAY